jgi:hypothetical protein
MEGLIMKTPTLAIFSLAFCFAASAAVPPAPATIAPGFSVEPQRIAYNNPGLRADVGVALWGWPLPMDFNHDGLIDLVVAGSGKPYNGTYFFENTGITDPESGLPLLKAGVRLGRAIDSPQVSVVDGQPVVMTAGAVYPDFLKSGLDRPEKINVPTPQQILGSSDPNLTKPGITGIRSSQWKVVDFDGDGRNDLIVGIDYWGDYQWGRANSGGSEPTYDRQGKWKFGPLHGYLYLLKNTGTNAAPVYAKPVQLTAGGVPIDVYGRPSPCFGDFRGTGKLDLICGEFIDGFTYFENIGTRTEPRYAAGRKLTLGGQPLTMDLCMIAPVECDFNGDGHLDLVVGQEDGRVAFLENTGAVVDGLPQFLPPRFFRQVADEVKFGVLSAPSAVDLDGDGLEDIVAGNSAGYVGFIKNLGAAVGGAGVPRGGRQDDSHPGRLQRRLPGSERSEVGLHECLCRRLGWRRAGRHPVQRCVGKSLLVSEHRHAHGAPVRGRRVHRSGVGWVGPEAGVELVEPHRQGTRD